MAILTEYQIIKAEFRLCLFLCIKKKRGWLWRPPPPKEAGASCLTSLTLCDLAEML